MLVKLTEVYEIPSESRYGLRQVSVNPQHVVAIREDFVAKQALMENRMPSGLDRRAEFSRVYLNNGNLNIVVVGSQNSIEESFQKVRQLLKG